MITRNIENRRHGRFAVAFAFHRPVVALLLAFLVMAGGCASDPAADVPAESITLSSSEQGCMTRLIADVDRPAEVCILRVGDTVTIEASGLLEGSVLTVEGTDGQVLELDLKAGQVLAAEVGGAIVGSSFTVRGTWADGETVWLGVDYAE
ncbi:MAG: hypothetical protein OEX97_01130 [Acidimicrobiia bacterium]|nr:hypothetical protein [Acidimicrobiia bacterium]